MKRPRHTTRSYSRLLSTLERIDALVTSRDFELVETAQVLFLSGVAGTLEGWMRRYLRQTKGQRASLQPTRVVLPPRIASARR